MEIKNKNSEEKIVIGFNVFNLGGRKYIMSDLERNLRVKKFNKTE